MAWRRGTGSVEVELSRCQDWIETNDSELNGHNGDKGVIRDYWESKASLKGAMAVLIFFGGGDFIIQILRLIGIVK